MHRRRRRLSLQPAANGNEFIISSLWRGRRRGRAPSQQTDNGRLSKTRVVSIMQSSYVVVCVLRACTSQHYTATEAKRSRAPPTFFSPRIRRPTEAFALLPVRALLLRPVRVDIKRTLMTTIYILASIPHTTQSHGRSNRRNDTAPRTRDDLANYNALGARSLLHYTTQRHTTHTHATHRHYTSITVYKMFAWCFGTHAFRQPTTKTTTTAAQQHTTIGLFAHLIREGRAQLLL